VSVNIELVALAFGAALAVLVCSRVVMSRDRTGRLGASPTALLVGFCFAALTVAPAAVGVWTWSPVLALLAAGAFAVASLTARLVLARMPPTHLK
jgi:hypothetical protein